MKILIFISLFLAPYFSLAQGEGYFEKYSALEGEGYFETLDDSQNNHGESDSHIKQASISEEPTSNTETLTPYEKLTDHEEHGHYHADIYHTHSLLPAIPFKIMGNICRGGTQNLFYCYIPAREVRQDCHCPTEETIYYYQLQYGWSLETEKVWSKNPENISFHGTVTTL